MFRPLVVLLTLLAVLWHTVAGCCALAGGGVERTARLSAEGECVPRAGLCRHCSAKGPRKGQGNESPGPGAPGGESEGESCRHAWCAFSATKPAELPGPTLLAGVEALEDDRSQAAARDARDEARFQVHPRPPAVRSHLLARVLLI